MEEFIGLSRSVMVTLVARIYTEVSVLSRSRLESTSPPSLP